jgi:hypothetical protein
LQELARVHAHRRLQPAGETFALQVLRLFVLDGPGVLPDTRERFRLTLAYKFIFWTTKAYFAEQFKTWLFSSNMFFCFLSPRAIFVPCIENT